MKKYILLFIASTIILKFTNAQTYLQGGVNFANISKSNSGQTEKNNTLASFNAGLLGRTKLGAKELNLESGLLITGQGSKAETYFNGGNDYVKTKFNPIYIQVPLNLVVKIPTNKSSNFFFYGGVYAAAGIGGKSSSETKLGLLTTSSSSSIKFSNDNPFTSQQDDAAYNKLKRFDFGVNIGGGLQLDKLILKANYSLGLTKINSTESNNNANDKNKYRTISLSIGFAID